MQKWLKNIDWGPIVGAALFLVLAFSVIPSTQEPPNSGEHQRKEIGDNQRSDWASWIDSNTVTAFSTTIIALFTIVLVFVTNRQARLTRESIDLARDEFSATHRPTLFVQTVTVTDRGKRVSRYAKGTDAAATAKPSKGIITIVNGGDSAAFIVGWRAIVYYQAPEAAFVPNLGVEPVQEPQADAPGISPGQWQEIGHTQIRPVEHDWERFANEGGKMFFLGRIAYRGPDGILRNTGFCREWDSKDRGTWVPVKESEYEYAY